MPVDRISCLPDGVQIHILSLLDTRDAVRTGVLSRRWHRMWAHVPVLKLHLSRMDAPKMLSLGGTLDSHAAPRISKFHLQLHDGSVTSTMVDTLVRRAVMRHVEDLSLDLSGFRRKYVLPDCLYSQSCLRELTLASCNLFTEGGRVNWGSLRVLNVGVGHIEGKIEDLLSGCPSLESLSLRFVTLSGGMHIAHDKLKRLVLDNSHFDYMDYKVYNECHVRAPQLEELEILGEWVWTSCKLIDVLSLVRVRLVFLFRINYDDANQMCVDAATVLFERDLENMVTESVCPTLSHRKCLVLKVLPDVTESDEEEEMI